MSGSLINGESRIHLPGARPDTADGRYVIYASYATNIVPNDTNNNWDVFLYDTLSGTTDRVSTNSSGAQIYYAHSPSISPDGRYVIFYGSAS